MDQPVFCALVRPPCNSAGFAPLEALAQPPLAEPPSQKLLRLRLPLEALAQPPSQSSSELAGGGARSTSFRKLLALCCGWRPPSAASLKAAAAGASAPMATLSTNDNFIKPSPNGYQGQLQPEGPTLGGPICYCAAQAVYQRLAGHGFDRGRPRWPVYQGRISSLSTAGQRPAPVAAL